MLLHNPARSLFPPLAAVALGSVCNIGSTSPHLRRLVSPCCCTTLRAPCFRPRRRSRSVPFATSVQLRRAKGGLVRCVAAQPTSPQTPLRSFCRRRQKLTRSVAAPFPHKTSFCGGPVGFLIRIGGGRGDGLFSMMRRLRWYEVSPVGEMKLLPAVAMMRRLPLYVPIGTHHWRSQHHCRRQHHLPGRANIMEKGDCFRNRLFLAGVEGLEVALQPHLRCPKKPSGASGTDPRLFRPLRQRRRAHFGAAPPWPSGFCGWCPFATSVQLRRTYGGSFHRVAAQPCALPVSAPGGGRARFPARACRGFGLYAQQKPSPPQKRQGRFWQGWRDSNPRHAVLETAALPTELHPCICLQRAPSPGKYGGPSGT